MTYLPLTFRQAPWVGDNLIDSLPTGSVVLSVGEGYGDIALRVGIRRPDLRVVAVDLSPKRVEYAEELRQRLGVKNVWFCVADVTYLPFISSAFEAGYVRGLLHILPDPASALAELRRVLRRRLLIDQLANRPWFALWFWLLQQYEIVRAWVQRRSPDRRIWADVEETLQVRGAYKPLWSYRGWFSVDHKAEVRANYLFIWETGRHRPLLGWFGYGGAIDVWL